jgi:hypothetical protein
MFGRIRESLRSARRTTAWARQQVADRPVATICGSLTRAGQPMRRVAAELRAQGYLVHCPMPTPSATAEEMAEKWRRHIDHCDLVVAVIVDGYIGEATRGELEHAERVGTPIRWVRLHGPEVHTLGCASWSALEPDVTDASPCDCTPDCADDPASRR